MSEPRRTDNNRQRFAREVASKARRKQKAQQTPPSFWNSFSLFGIIGWSVSIPTLLAIMLGLWLDRHLSDARSWTLVMIPVGLLVGCLTAWHWISYEQRQIRKHEEEEDD